MKLIRTFMLAMVNAGVSKPQAPKGREHLTAIFDDIENADFELIERSKNKVIFKHLPSDQTYYLERNIFVDGHETVNLYFKGENKDQLITGSIKANSLDDNKNIMAGFNRMVNMVRSYDELVSLCEAGISEFYLVVGGCMRSSKNIVMTGKDKFSILNEIDGSYQNASKKNLEAKTNIMTGIENECFFAY